MSFRLTVRCMAESHIEGVQESPDDAYLTPSQVAQRWSVSLRTVQRYIADGRLRAIKLPGGYYRVRPADADAAVEASA